MICPVNRALFGLYFPPIFRIVVDYQLKSLFLIVRLLRSLLLDLIACGNVASKLARRFVVRPEDSSGLRPSVRLFFLLSGASHLLCDLPASGRGVWRTDDLLGCAQVLCDLRISCMRPVIIVRTVSPLRYNCPKLQNIRAKALIILPLGPSLWVLLVILRNSLVHLPHSSVDVLVHWLHIYSSSLGASFFSTSYRNSLAPSFFSRQFVTPSVLTGFVPQPVRPSIPSSLAHIFSFLKDVR